LINTGVNDFTIGRHRFRDFPDQLFLNELRKKPLFSRYRGNIDLRTVVLCRAHQRRVDPPLQFSSRCFGLRTIEDAVDRGLYLRKTLLPLQ
jgi:hypothetical protein